MKLLTHAALCGALGVAQMAATAWLQEQTDSKSQDKIVAVSAFRASTLIGMPVKNTGGENLGKINELVVDVESGEVLYAALSVGGVLGVGDKLLAIPWKEFRVMHEEKDTYFLLDIAKEKLEVAPGFDEANWPDMADQEWRDEIDRYYHEEQDDDVKEGAPPRGAQ